MVVESDLDTSDERKGKKLRVENDCALLHRQELALCYRLCERFKFHEGVCNHLSWQIPGKDRFLLIAYGVHWSQATASDILVLDFEGNVLEGNGQPERTGFVSHRAIHRALGSEAAAVLHTHMPNSTALTCLRPECGGHLLPIHQNMLKFNGSIAYDDDWGGLFDEGESDRTTSVLTRFKKEHGRCPRVMLSANHGVFAFGSTIAEAWDNLYYLERMCEVQVRALSCAGGDVSRLRLIRPEALEDGASLAESDRPLSIDAHWTAMKGMMRNEKPDYCS